MTKTMVPLPAHWRELERMGMDAFPAIFEERKMGAIFRAGGGISYRNSSVTLLDPQKIDIDALLDETLIFSANHGIEPVLRLPRLWPNLEQQLGARGWEVFRDSAVFEVPLPQHTWEDPSLEPAMPPESWDLFQLDARGLEGQSRQALAEIFSLIPEHASRLHYRPEGQKAPLASAMLWFDGNHCGLMNMLVTPQARGKGVGRRFLDAMFAYSKPRGATVMWLQVHLENKPATALYARAGFEKVYDYTYWRPDVT